MLKYNIHSHNLRLLLSTEDHFFDILEKMWFSTETVKKYVHLNYCVSEKVYNNSQPVSTMDM